LAATARRLRGVCGDGHITVVTAAEQVDLVRADLPELGADDVFAEPSARNTAAALGLAAVQLVHRDPDAIMGAIPADQHIADEAGFAAAAERAFTIAAASDVIVTIGIVPTHPETGFGYLEVGEDRGDGSHQVARFVEKPDLETARSYLEAGTFLWNGGMFFTRARHLLAQIEEHMPQTHAGLAEIAAALAEGGPERGAEVAARAYPPLPKVSIDYGVMEKAANVACVRGDFGWNDVGSWDALATLREPDSDGNTVYGTAVLTDSRDNIVVGEDERVIALVGVSGLVVVQSDDKILVIPRERAQDVREAVAALKTKGLDRFL
jgi:mannose-1-phosphate guanylyltransferase